MGRQNGQWLGEFIDRQYHGTMEWMEKTKFRRSHPHNLWPEAKSAIVLGFNYGPEIDPMSTVLKKTKATISVYARNKDYHALMKGKLKELAGLLARDTHMDVKIFVDTAPLMEKPLAALGGLGWQGKHTNLVNRNFGSWLFLGVILSAAKLPASPHEKNNCGTCRACLDICPTDAFPAAYKLDARKCISYLTIELHGPIDEYLRPKLGNRIYGCDDCLAICPWNKYAKVASEAKLIARADLITPDLAFLASLNDADFRKHFSGSPIKRIGRDRFLRNVLYAIGNSADLALLPCAQRHENAIDKTVKDAALWAIKRLTSAPSCAPSCAS